MTIPDKSDGDVLFARELWKFVDDDKTQNAFNTSGTDPVLVGSVIVPANTISGGLLAMSNYVLEYANQNSSTAWNGFIEMRIGSATNYTDLPLIGGSLALLRGAATSHIDGPLTTNGAMNRFYSGADWSEQNMVAIGVRVSNGGLKVILDNITVLGF